MKKLIISFCFFNILATSVYAEQLPQSTRDNRMQFFRYVTDDVFVIKTKFGHASLIQFAEDEIIHDDGGLGVGEARDWSTGVKGNNVFFKPLKAVIEPTNMIIVTNKRTYAFALHTTQGNDMTYVARFSYPDKKIDPAQQSQYTPSGFQRVKQQGETFLIDANINMNYKKRGNMDITPTAMWDNGLFTFLQYNNAKELPTVYKVMPDGSESLVNTHIKDDTIIIHEVAKLYRLRLGKAVAELSNQRYKDSDFNNTGTSEKHTFRLIK